MLKNRPLNTTQSFIYNLPGPESSQSEEQTHLRTAHEALVSVLQRTHHSRHVALFNLLLGGLDRLLRLLQLLLVEGELDGVGGRLRPQVVHPSLQTLRREEATVSMPMDS